MDRQGSSGGLSAKKDESGKLLVKFPGRNFTFPSSIYRVPDRKADMSKLGVTIQVLSQSGPWTDVFEPSVSVSLSRLVNDWISKVVNEERDKFFGLATLPMQDPTGAVKELTHASEIGLKGAIVGSNINGKYLDSPDFHQIFETCERLGLVIFVHPAEPYPWKAQEYGLTVTLSFPFETTETLTRLVLSGVLEKYPKLKIFAAHSGGTIPYLAGRLDRAHEWMPEAKGKIEKPPSYYFKKMYCDALCFNKDSLRQSINFFGEDRVVFGSDYPFPWGADIALSVIRSAGLDQQVEKKIMNQNAATLLGI